VSLQFRMIADDLRPDPFAAATEATTAWVAGKRPGLAVPGPAEPPVAADGLEVRVLAADDGALRLLRYVVVEDTGTGRWTTTVTAMAADDRSWQWVDLERVADDPWGPQPVVAAPGVVGRLLAAGTLRIASTPLPARLLRVGPDEVPALADVLLHPGRAVPVVVVSRPADPADVAGTVATAATLARDLLGVAPVYLLEQGVGSALSARLGGALHVYGGAARTYLPGLGPDDDPGRHRVLGPARVRDTRLAARTIAAPLRRMALAARPPLPYRERGRDLVRGGPVGDQLTGLADLLAVEERAEQLEDQLRQRATEADETEAQLDASRARVRWLEAELAKHGSHVTGRPADPDGVPETVGSFAEAVLAALDLDHLVVGELYEGAEALDDYPGSAPWARKAWRALRALDAYARARADGYDRDFYTWCRSPDSGGHAIPANWVVLAESDTTDNDPKFWQPRVFPVPTTVHPDGEIYMPAHVKIVEGGRPAPRLHFHDDTGGSTRKVHVGCLGPHLPNKQTN